MHGYARGWTLLGIERPRLDDVRTLSEWLNAVVDAGFTIERIAEPHADEETARRVPHVADTRIVAYYLHMRCRKATSPAA